MKSEGASAAIASGAMTWARGTRMSLLGSRDNARAHAQVVLLMTGMAAVVFPSIPTGGQVDLWLLRVPGGRHQARSIDWLALPAASTVSRALQRLAARQASFVFAVSQTSLEFQKSLDAVGPLSASPALDPLQVDRLTSSDLNRLF
jgi:hypothetical protein